MYLFLLSTEEPHLLTTDFLSSLLTFIKLILHMALQCASHKNGTCPLLFLWVLGRKLQEKSEMFAIMAN